MTIKTGQAINVNIPDYAEIKVRRANGEIETAKFGGATALTPEIFAKIKKATLAAGKGECLSYRNVTMSSTYVVTAHDAAVDFSAKVGTVMRRGE